jgi:putative hydrolase of the HAD superfamily
MLFLFDLDDTLVDYQTADRNATLCLYKSVNASKPFAEFFAAWVVAQERHYPRYYSGEISFQDQRRERIREVIDPTLNDDTADRMFADYLNAYEANWALYDDALPCLNKLSSHHLGIITNGDGALQRRKLAKMGIADKFDCIVISSECGCSKPDPKIFLHACELVGEAPENAIHVGDRYDLDALGARNAGLNGIWLDRHAKAAPEHIPPIIKSLAEL